jgi:hypothetical protein
MYPTVPSTTPSASSSTSPSARPAPAPSAVPSRTLVHHGRHRWVLAPGQSVSFGRGSPCDIRIAHDPVDDHVSRRAGVVEFLGEDVVVRNESATRTLIFSPARGSERVIRPGEAITCLPHREFLVALSGRSGSHYVLQVTAGLPAEGLPAEPPPAEG